MGRTDSDRRRRDDSEEGDRDRRRSRRSRSRSRSRSRGASRSPDRRRRGRDRDHRDRGRDRDRSADRAREGGVEDGEVGDRAAAPPPPPPEPQGGGGGGGGGAPPAASEDMPPIEELKPVTNESGGEISMSIDETNRIRASLGLKPLRESSKATEAKKAAEEAHQDKVEREQAAAKAEDLAARVAEARAKRKLNDSYKKVKTLGEGDDVGDDLGAWVKKSRTVEEKRKAKEREAALKMARQLEQQDEEAEDSDEEGPYGSKALAGMKVKHSAEELDAGETMILTLEDKGILDDSGNLVEEEDADALVNSSIAAEKKVAKAKRAAMKRGIHYGEDGKERSLLDKYDEEEAEDEFSISADGGVDPEKLKRQRDIRAKLAAKVTGEKEDLNTEAKAISDFYTSEEMQTLFKPKKKKKKKKEKKLRQKDSSDLIAALEAEAAAKAPEGEAGGGELGNRRSRVNREDAAAKEELEKAEKRASAYQAALDKANKASEALRGAGRAAEEGLEEDEADAELQASLARARRTAQKKTAPGTGLQEVAESITKARAENDAEMTLLGEEGAEEGVQFTEATEFIRGIGNEDPEAAPAAAAPDADVEMEDDMEEAAAAPEAKKEEEQEGAAEAEETGDAEAGTGGGEGSSVFTGQNIGKGMFGALSTLRDTGDLRNKKEWSGRTNDMKPVALIGIDDMFEKDEDNRISASVEAALTKRDEFGRVMTPKEAFRELCHSFHGIQPSKNKQEKRLRKYQEELAVKKMQAGDTPLSSANRLRDVQNSTAQPFVVLSGRGATSEASLAAAVKRNEEAGLTPMLGDRKVEMMLGIKKPPKGPGKK